MYLGDNVVSILFCFIRGPSEIQLKVAKTIVGCIKGTINYVVSFKEGKI